MLSTGALVGMVITGSLLSAVVAWKSVPDGFKPDPPPDRLADLADAFGWTVQHGAFSDRVVVGELDGVDVELRERRSEKAEPLWFRVGPIPDDLVLRPIGTVAWGKAQAPATGDARVDAAYTADAAGDVVTARMDGAARALLMGLPAPVAMGEGWMESAFGRTTWAPGRLEPEVFRRVVALVLRLRARDGDVGDLLVDRIRNDVDVHVRARALSWLADRHGGHPELVQLVEASIQGWTGQAQYQAATVLGRPQDMAALVASAAADMDMRDKALAALFESGNLELVTRMVDTLLDESVDMPLAFRREAVRWAAGRQGKAAREQLRHLGRQVVGRNERGRSWVDDAEARDLVALALLAHAEASDEPVLLGMLPWLGDAAALRVIDAMKHAGTSLARAPLQELHLRRTGAVGIAAGEAEAHVAYRTQAEAGGRVSLAEQLGGEVSLSKTVGGEVDVVEES